MSKKNKTVRVSDTDKKRIKDLQIKAKNLGGSLRESEIISAAIQLVSDKHLKNKIVNKRSGVDRKTILKNEWLRQNPKKTMSEFEDFTMTQEWITFVERHRQLLGA